ncbi:Fic family protein [bacterium]|nr:MAG: Fic family protein [bacterium]
MLCYELNSSQISGLKLLSEDMALQLSKMEAWPLDLKDPMKRLAMVSNIGASTRIENAVLTDAEVYWIDTELSESSRPTSFREKEAWIENKLSKDRERSIEEVAGCRAMLQIIYGQAQELFPVTETSLRALHQELLQFYPPARPYLGRYKVVTNSVIERDRRGGQERTVFRTADPGPITEAAMHDLVQWYNQELPQNPWSVPVACEWVFRFLAIHPFQDGNGRLGRGLWALALLQSPDTTLARLAPYLAVDRQIERHRQEYYQVLQRCSGGEFHQDPSRFQIGHFLQFMIKMLRLSLQDIDFYRGRVLAVQELSESALKVYEAFRDHPEKRLSTQELLRLTGLPRRTIIHAFNRLVERSLIQRRGRGAGVRYQVLF